MEGGPYGIYSGRGGTSKAGPGTAVLVIICLLALVFSFFYGSSNSGTPSTFANGVDKLGRNVTTTEPKDK